MIDRSIPNGLSKSNAPSLCIFLDTETVSKPGRLPGIVNENFRLAVAIKAQRRDGKWGSREVRRFEHASDLWDWIHELESLKRPIWIFGHNIGFDLTVSGFWDHVVAGRWSTRDLWALPDGSGGNGPGTAKPWRGCLVVTDPPTILVLRSRKGSLRLIDTFNYFRGSLAEMGASIGIDQLAKPAPTDSQECWFDRCERDAHILELAVCGWLDRWCKLACGEWAYTCAGLGYRAWRNCLKKFKVWSDHSERQIDYAREACFWGQTEVFYSGEVKGPVHHLDVRALYPSVMRSNQYPQKYLGCDLEIPIDHLLERSKYHLPIARVRVVTGDETYPVRRNGKIHFATGDYVTYLCGTELAGAIARGHVRRVLGVCWYKPADLFGAFVDRWLEVRSDCEAAGDLAGAMLAKMIVNSISGKFAQRKIVWVDRPDRAAFCWFGEWHTYNVDSKKMTRYRSIAGNVQEFTQPGEGRDSFPAISAMITANGRERMRQLRSVCPPRTVLYQDTDSLFVLPQGYLSLVSAGYIVPGLAGCLQEKDIWTWLEIRGFKFYGHDKGIVCPGLKKNARLTRPGEWNQSRFQRLADKLSRYDGPFIEVAQTDFTPVGSLGNRKSGKDGWTVAPHIVDPS